MGQNDYRRNIGGNTNFSFDFYLLNKGEITGNMFISMGLQPSLLIQKHILLVQLNIKPKS